MSEPVSGSAGSEARGGNPGARVPTELLAVLAVLVAGLWIARWLADGFPDPWIYRGILLACGILVALVAGYRWLMGPRCPGCGERALLRNFEEPIRYQGDLPVFAFDCEACGTRWYRTGNAWNRKVEERGPGGPELPLDAAPGSLEEARTSGDGLNRLRGARDQMRRYTKRAGSGSGSEGGGGGVADGGASG